MLDPQSIMAAETTISGKIRALSNAGYSRADISRLVERRYQHVRNVLEGDRIKAPVRPLHALPTRQVGPDDPVQRIHRLALNPDGSITLPAAVVEALGLRIDEPLIGELSDDQLVLMNWRVSASRAQAYVRSMVPAGVSLADELIAERREEARRELHDE